MDSEAYSQLALLGLVVAGVFVPLNFWRRLFAPKLLRARHAASDQVARVASWSRKSGVNLHMVFGTATLGLGILHGLTASASNLWLWAGMAGLLALLVLGTIIHWRWIPFLAKQRVLLFSTKWGISLASLALLAYGHAAADPEFGAG